MNDQKHFKEIMRPFILRRRLGFSCVATAAILSSSVLVHNTGLVLLLEVRAFAPTTKPFLVVVPSRRHHHSRTLLVSSSSLKKSEFASSCSAGRDRQRSAAVPPLLASTRINQRDGDRRQQHPGFLREENDDEAEAQQQKLAVTAENAVAFDCDGDPADDSDEETYRIAIRNTILSIAVAVAFGAGLWAWAGATVGQEFFAGYIVEKSLSVDNLFVFLLLFDFFQVPPAYQNRILTWGIYGSVVMRAVMIGLGAAALKHFHGVLLVFAAILIYSAVQVLVDVEEQQQADLSSNPVVRFSRSLCESNDTCDVDHFDSQTETGTTNLVVLFSTSLFPSTSEYDGDRFFTVGVDDGIKKATPLFVCMVAVELSDIVFAVDSIPAVFGVTENPLVVFSSNMFAILGLRSLYPVLSKAATDLKYLEPAVAVILAFIGGKMIAEYLDYAIPTEVALAVILSLLGIGVGASVWERRHESED